MNFKEYMESKLEEQVVLNEVKFSEKNLSKVAGLYGKIMGKRMGGSFGELGVETFNRKTGAGAGIRLINEKGVQLRFNWDKKRAKKAQFDLTSIDYWDHNNINFTKPTRTVMFASDLNVVQVLGKITEALLVGSINEAQVSIDEANDMIFEGRSTQEKKEWMLSNDMPGSYTSPKNMRLAIKNNKPHLMEELEIFLGQQETNSLEDELVKSDKLLDKTLYADPETIFSELEDLAGMVAGKFTKSLVVTGMGGIGKTYHVDKIMKEELGKAGGDWEMITAPKASMTNFYKDCYLMRDKIVVWDECDDLFNNGDIMTALKGALDTSGVNYMTYSPGNAPMVGKTDEEVDDFIAEVDMAIAEGKQIGPGKGEVQLPSKFRFTGAMVFISNMPIAKFRKVDSGGALMSRSLFIDIFLESTDVIRRIKTIGHAMAPSSYFTVADVDEVVDALNEAEAETDILVRNGIHYATAGDARRIKGVTVRAMVTALKLKVLAKKPNWKILAQKFA